MGPVKEPEFWFAQSLRCGLQDVCKMMFLFYPFVLHVMHI